MLTWRTCQECAHDAWQGGRNCLQHEHRWLCRRCFQARQGVAEPQLELGSKVSYYPAPRNEDASTGLSLASWLWIKVFDGTSMNIEKALLASRFWVFS